MVGFYLKMLRMNEIVNKYLLTADKFLPEVYLRQPGFACSACRPFTKNKERILKSKETGDLASLKTEMDKLDVDKLKAVPAVHDKLVTKVNAVDTKIPSTNGFISKTI